LSEIRNGADDIEGVFVMHQMTFSADGAELGVAIVGQSIQHRRATSSAVFDQLSLIAQAFFAGALAAGSLACFSINARAVSINLRPSKPRLFMSSIHSTSSARDLRRNS